MTLQEYSYSSTLLVRGFSVLSVHCLRDTAAQTFTSSFTCCDKKKYREHTHFAIFATEFPLLMVVLLLYYFTLYVMYALIAHYA